MGLMEEMKIKLNEGMEKLKQGASFAADKTKKGANIARIQLEIKIEEGKINKSHAQLGKHVFGLMNNGVFDMSNDEAIKNIMEEIKKCEDSILKQKEKMKSA